jgi:hypothetical protein
VKEGENVKHGVAMPFSTPRNLRPKKMYWKCLIFRWGCFKENCSQFLPHWERKTNTEGNPCQNSRMYMLWRKCVLIEKDTQKNGIQVCLVLRTGVNYETWHSVKTSHEKNCSEL